MRIKIMSVAAAALLLAAQARALVDASLFGGYTMVGMAGVNGFLDEAIKNPSAGTTVSATKLSGGYIVGAEAGLALMPFLHFGPRVEMIGVGAGSFKRSSASSTLDATIEPQLINLLASVHTSIDLPMTGLSVKAGVYGGHGLATSKVTVKGTGVGAMNGDSTFSGAGFVSGVEAGLGYSIIPLLSLDLNAGMRLADLRAMTATADNTNLGFKSGQPWKYTDSANKLKDVEYDFSGFNATLSLRLSF